MRADVLVLCKSFSGRLYYHPIYEHRYFNEKGTNLALTLPACFEFNRKDLLNQFVASLPNKSYFLNFLPYLFLFTFFIIIMLST